MSRHCLCFSLLSSPGVAHFMDECNDSAMFCKQTNNLSSSQSCFFFKKKKKKRWCIRLRHIRIAFRVLKGLPLEPGTSKENQSLTCDVRCSVVGLALRLCVCLAEKPCSPSPASGTLQKWGVDHFSFICGLARWINHGFSQRATSTTLRPWV